MLKALCRLLLRPLHIPNNAKSLLGTVVVVVVVVAAVRKLSRHRAGVVVIVRIPRETRRNSSKEPAAQLPSPRLPRHLSFKSEIRYWLGVASSDKDKDM